MAAKHDSVAEPDFIVVKGAREHNLAIEYLEIPKKQLVVFTGVSGSGKSSLVGDVLETEARRRFLTCREHLEHLQHSNGPKDHFHRPGNGRQADVPAQTACFLERFDHRPQACGAEIVSLSSGGYGLFRGDRQCLPLPRSAAFTPPGQEIPQAQSDERKVERDGGEAIA